jgi:uncharacterized protein YecE (DUF72 family)
MPEDDTAAALDIDGGTAAQSEIGSDGRPVGNVYYGTSSWTDKTLIASKRFYPPSASSAEERLRYYADRFPCVEVDSTYYALPAERNAQLWVERTPSHFVFNVKAFGLLTQHPVSVRSLPPQIRDELPKEAREKERVYPKDLPEPANELVWSMFASAIEPLRAAGKLGAVLFQFPRWFVRSRRGFDYLRALAERVDYPVAVEFRGGGWMEEGKRESTLAQLEELGMAYVVVDEPQGSKSSTPPVVACTSQDLAIVRFHGHNEETWEKPGLTAAERFRYLYSEEELERWVEPVRELAGQAKQVQVLMNNCYQDYGVRNASQMAALLREKPVFA